MKRSPFLIVIVTDQAWDGAIEIFNYLENRFSYNLADSYLDGLKSAFDILAAMPDLGVEFQGDVRKFVWKKYTLIFYRYDYNYLYIIDVVDSRSSPIFYFF